MAHEYPCPVCKRGSLHHRRTTLVTVKKDTLDNKASYACDHKGCRTTLIVVDEVIVKHWAKRSTRWRRVVAAWLAGDRT